MVTMSDDQDEAEEPDRDPHKISIEFLGDQTGAKFDKLKDVLGPVVGQPSKLARMAELFGEQEGSQSLTERLGAFDVLADIDYSSTPEMRAASAAETTAERLDLLVTAQLKAFEDGKARDKVIDRRERVMAWLQVVNVIVALVAAVAAVAVLFG